MKIAFIIPTYNRHEMLRECLESLFKELQTYDNINVTVAVVFNGEKSQAFTDKWKSKENILWLETSRVTPAQARNFAVRTIESDYYYFIDDDTLIPLGFFNSVRDIIKNYPEVEIFGGPDRSIKDATIFERALEGALQSPLTTSKTRERHTYKNDEAVYDGSEKNLILCNLVVHQKVFKEKEHWFDENYQRNEENVFLIMAAQNCCIKYVPKHFIFHRRRSSLKSVFRAASQSGFYRLKMIKELSSKNQMFYLCPLLFLGYLALMPLAYVNWGHIVLIPFYLYCGSNFLTSFKIALDQKQLYLLPLIMFYQFFIVLSYGIGTLFSLFSLKR